MDERSIASITKVMTAIVFLESATDLNQEVTIERSDTLRASTTYLKTNDRVRVSDLLHLLLIPSDNAAARALARISPLGSRRFHRAHESEGGRSGSEPDRLHRSVGLAERQHLVGLRHGAPHRLCI